MTFRVLDHTADTGIEATAPDLPGLIAELARGMFALMARVDDTSGSRSITTSVKAEDRVEMMVDSLSELLYLSETEDLIFNEVHAAMDEPGTIAIEARGVPPTQAEPVGPPIKAVTYHDAVVAETVDGWHGRVYFDV